MFAPNQVSEMTFEALQIVDHPPRSIPVPYEQAKVSKARMVVLRMQSPEDRVIQLTTSTRSPAVGKYIIFNVQATFFLQEITWIISSKGLLLMSGNEVVRALSHTFTVAVTPEMAPKAHAVVYTVLTSGEVVADKFTFPVDGISRHKISVLVNHHKDYYKRTFEIVARGDPLAFVGFSAVERGLYPLMAGLGALSRADILRSLHNDGSASEGKERHRYGVVGF